MSEDAVLIGGQLRQKRLEALENLGLALSQALESPFFQDLLRQVAGKNPWFSPDNSRFALQSIIEHYLEGAKLRAWFGSYDWPEVQELKRVGLVLAGNLPLVGFQDWLCVFVSGHKALIKCSDKDNILLPFVLKILVEQSPEMQDSFELVERLKNFDAVIATGSDQTGLYFQQYFGKYPHIIRGQRNSVAVLDGQESLEDLQRLGQDVFRYFGLGCRSVSKVYLPKGYQPETLLRAWESWEVLLDHTKYRNNYEYNRALFLLNQVQHLASDGLLLLESSSLTARIASLHYEFYEDQAGLCAKIEAEADKIQVIVSRREDWGLKGLKVKPLGMAQSPRLEDYADGIDVLDFLRRL